MKTTSITVFGRGDNPKRMVTIGVDKSNGMATVYAFDVKLKEFIYESQQPIEKYDEIIQEVKNLFDVLCIAEEK